MAACGEAFLIDSGASGKHLFVIIWGQGQVPWIANHDVMVLVNATTLDPNIPHDPGCILNAGDHAFIKHDSYMAYRWIRYEQPSHIDHMRQQGLFISQPDVDPIVLKRIRVGLCKSKLTDRRLKKLVGCPP